MYTPRKRLKMWELPGDEAKFVSLFILKLTESD
jgi:hypothetical protein